MGWGLWGVLGGHRGEMEESGLGMLEGMVGWGVGMLGDWAGCCREHWGKQKFPVYWGLVMS